MPEIEIRPAIASDIPALIALEHGYSSDHAWQMEFRRQGDQVSITFRQIRLPRSVQVQYPHSPAALADDWQKRDGLLVAVREGEPLGYISLSLQSGQYIARVTDMAVGRRFRRQKIGSALVLAAQDWALQMGSRRLVLEMQPKNYPAIQMARKLGFELCGYQDHYFANQDIALFFSKWLK